MKPVMYSLHMTIHKAGIGMHYPSVKGSRFKPCELRCAAQMLQEGWLWSG